MRPDGRALGAALLLVVAVWRGIGAWWGRALASPEAGALWERLQGARPAARWLSDWALRHRALVWFFMVVIVASGVFSYKRLGRNEDPPFTIKTMVVQAAWPGATSSSPCPTRSPV